MHLSVVIPTYNRGPKLAPTIAAVLASDTDGLEQVEIVVVDDGSWEPAEPVVKSFAARPPFTLRCLRQSNAGPAAARNAGFRDTRGSLVLFMDDDILVPPRLLRQHVDAHRPNPGAVVFGPCLLIRPDSPTPFFRYVDEVLDTSAKSSSQELVPQETLGSGHLSVERRLFEEGGVYRDDLAIPGAEEFELAYRLGVRRVPMLSAPYITAQHDTSVTIASVCGQQYKHALGCAEVASRCPETLNLRDLRRMIEANRPGAAGGVLKDLAKGLTARRAFLRGLLRLAHAAEAVTARTALLWPLYSAAIRAHFCAGIRDGLQKFARPALPETRPASLV